MIGRWDIATCSYAGFREEYGVPIRTSVGPHPAYRDVEHIGALTPYGIFGVMADQPVAEQRAAYWSRLHRFAASIDRRLDQLTDQHAVTLVLLCWCRDSRTCHRGWAADWFAEHHGLTVPELTSYPCDNASIQPRTTALQPHLPLPDPTAEPGPSTASQHQPWGDHS